jgi:putative ABC transport system permease protein
VSRPARVRPFVRLAAQSLGRRPLRALFLAGTVAVGVGTVFAASVVRQAVHDSLALGIARMGADLVVVPRDTLVNLTTALLVAEPTPHTLDAGLVEEVARLPGVEAVAPQRVFALTGISASQVPDVIAFDPARDFTVLPWLRQTLGRPLRSGDAIVGGRRPEAVGAGVQLGGRTLTVYGRLDLTGVGALDRSVLVSFDTLEALADARRATSAPPMFAEARSRASALLVRLAPGGSAERVRFALASQPAVKVIAGASLATSVRHMLTTLLGGAAGLVVLVLAATVVMVGVLHAALLIERRRELGVLLMLGARPRQILHVIVAEAVLLTTLGGVAGVIAGGGVLLAVRRSLGFHLASLDVPLVWPPAALIVLAGASGVALASRLGLVGAVIPAWRLSRREPLELIRREAS